MTVVSRWQADGVLFWQITSIHRAAIEAEILRIQCDALVVQSEFFHPWREFKDGRQQWRATGYTVLK